MPWNWRKKRAAAEAGAADEHATTSNRQQAQQRGQHSQLQHNNTNINRSADSTVIQCRPSICSSTNTDNRDDDAYEMTNTVVRRLTPVLFSTNRGLYLRTAKPLPTQLANASMGVSVPVSVNTNANSTSQAGSGTAKSRLPTACVYDLRFCDLERWSTNRANTVSLEDTFTVRARNNRIATPNLAAIESSGNSCCGGSGGSHNGNNCFLMRSHNSYPMTRCFNQHPRRDTSLQSNFARFDMQ